MNSVGLLVVLLALLSVVGGRPRKSPAGSESELELSSGAEVREKRKYEIPVVRELEVGGTGAKRESGREEKEEEEEAEVAASQGGMESTAGSAASEVANPPPGGHRVKKQSPNNVCIKIGGCGKTACGPIVSAHGPVVSDMRAIMQGGKPIIQLGDLQSTAIGEMSDIASKVDRFAPVQGRTVDTIVAPIALGTMGYGNPAAYSSQPPALDLAHSFFKPPAMSTVPAVAVITAPHQPAHPLVHLMPHLMPHLVPHLMPHLMAPLMPNFGSYLVPHRLEPSPFPDTFQTDVKHPLPAFPPPSSPSYALNGDATLLCQPFRNQRLDGPYDYVYKPDSPVDKTINVTDLNKKSRNGVDPDDDPKLHDHLKKVNEIRDEIQQLNRAAQRIVDQQERLTAMQQKQLWGTSASSPSASPSSYSSSSSSDHISNPYIPPAYYAHPATPWSYSRSNILSYPRSEDDIDFFINLLRAGKKMGLLSDLIQPSHLPTIGETLKGITDPGKSQKDAVDAAPARPDEPKSTRTEKKSPT